MTETFAVPDVSCGHCKSAIEEALGPTEGVRRATVDIESKAVTVDFDPDVIDRAEIVQQLEAAGYPVSG